MLEKLVGYVLGDSLISFSVFVGVAGGDDQVLGGFSEVFDSVYGVEDGDQARFHNPDLVVGELVGVVGKVFHGFGARAGVTEGPFL